MGIDQCHAVGTHGTGGWVSPGLVWTCAESLFSH